MGSDLTCDQHVPIDFIARTTDVSTLKASLDAGALRVRGIADRIARASANTKAFELPADGTAPAAQGEPVDLELEMANLADEQLRFEATARLLQKTYAGLRASLQNR